MKIQKAKEALDIVINKARVHLYKPIQIAEILYRDRKIGDVDLRKLETYRTQSRAWRDIICMRFLNKISTSSARYQDDIFNPNATPPRILEELGKENRKKSGIVEAYIYRSFQKKQVQMINTLNYIKESGSSSFNLESLIDRFWNEPGLRRSIDKIFEIVVYSLFQVIICELETNISISVPKNKKRLLNEFRDFTIAILGVSPENLSIDLPASVYRVGLTNASDRGLDMWANFGPAIQIKHLSLTEEVADNIVSSVSADRIVVVCKDVDKEIIEKLLKQIDGGYKIQGIVSESDLNSWYKRAFNGKFRDVLAPKIIEVMKNEVVAEFPTSDQSDFLKFFNERGYKKIDDSLWQI